MVRQQVPFLYFTVNALDGIADLFSARTVILGLLNEEQQRLTAALRLRWELTQRYWATIATFGEARWPLEDIPWKTTDGRESDYYSLLVTSSESSRSWSPAGDGRSRSAGFTASSRSWLNAAASPAAPRAPTGEYVSTRPATPVRLSEVRTSPEDRG